MKKIIITIMLIVYANYSYAYEKGFGFSAELGKSLIQTSYPGMPKSDRNQTMTYTDVEIHYVLQFWNIQLIPYGGTKTWFIAGNNIFDGGQPFNDTYYYGSKIKYGNVTFYYEHYCSHSVYSSPAMWAVDDYRLGQNSDRIAIRYEFN